MALLAVLALAFSACGKSVPGSSGDSGIRGVVLLGPMCPVMRAGSPCPDRPLADAEVRVLQGGDVVATATSDAEGRFEIGLEPGHYVVEAVVEPNGPGMSSKPVDVSVPASGFRSVDVLVDTGIRAAAPGSG